MRAENRYDQVPIIALVFLTLFFCLFVLIYEKQAAISAQENLDRHALIIADDLWNFNVEGVAEYLKLAAKADNYEYLEVVSSNGELFHKVHNQPSAREIFLINLHLIPRVVIISQVKSRTNTIGWIKALWLPHTITYQFIVLIFAALFQLIITLYCRILKTKTLLEQRVIERTSELTQTNANLLREIHDRTQAEKEREDLQRRLERSKKMETLGVLAGGVAHDLNNVLSGIVSYPDMILRDLPETSPMRGPISLIRDSGLRAAEIVQDLLTLARRGVVTKTPQNLNRLVEEYLSSPEHKKLLDHHPQLHIESAFEQEGGVVLGSAVALKKVIMNLVSNGAEAMPDGGTVKITTKHIRLESPVEGFQNIDAGEWLLFSVCDEGEGIGDEDLARIFEPFYTKKVMGRSGSGLGLTVVWGTVEDHFGAIDIHRRAPKGTTIDIYLPVSDTTHEQPVQRSEETLQGEGQSILIVDDIEHQREIATAILTRLGYRAIAVASGEEACAWLSENNADLLVLDMIMEGGMDGLETYQKIIEFRPGQKAIIASGYSETDRVKMAQRLGAGQYIKKPYQFTQLAEAVWKELRKVKTEKNDSGGE